MALIDLYYFSMNKDIIIVEPQQRPSSTHRLSRTNNVLAITDGWGKGKGLDGGGGTESLVSKSGQHRQGNKQVVPGRHV